MGKSNIIDIVSHQTDFGGLEKEIANGVRLKAGLGGREKLAATAATSEKGPVVRESDSSKNTIGQNFMKDGVIGNKLPDDDSFIEISSDEDEAKVNEETHEKEVNFFDLKRRAYQFLDHFFEDNLALMTELRTTLEVVFFPHGLKLIIFPLS